MLGADLTASAQIDGGKGVRFNVVHLVAEVRAK
jgi:hypothetical protein